MPIPSQPTIVISLGPRSGLPDASRSLATEFMIGDDNEPNSYGLSYLFRGGNPEHPTASTFVADHPVNSGVPTYPGPISLSQFNGSSIVYRYNISSSTQNFNLLNYATSALRSGTTKDGGYINDAKYIANQPGYGIEVVIGPTAVIGSATRTQNAFETGINGPTGWHPDIKIVVKNQGQIIGAGGQGAKSAPMATAGSPGQSGGTAFVAQRAVTIQNAGTIAGGGGGGGSGGSGFNGFTPQLGGGGGGGAGQTAGQGGQGGGPPAGPFPAPTSGQAGSLLAGGNGGASSAWTPAPAGSGGRGGTISPTAQPLTGQAGTQGTGPAPNAGGAGGAAGFYAKGDANITWQANGTRIGQVQPTV